MKQFGYLVFKVDLLWTQVYISKTGNGGVKEQSLAKRERICVPLKAFEQWSMGEESGKMRIEIDDGVRVGIWTILLLSISFRTQFNSYFFKVLQFPLYKNTGKGLFQKSG